MSQYGINQDLPGGLENKLNIGMRCRCSVQPIPENLAERSREELAALVPLYEIEADLVQQKVGHILAIRGLGITVFSAIVGATVVSPAKGLEYLSLTMLLFYVLDAVYDGYLIPIVIREEALRVAISDLWGKLDFASTNLGPLYGKRVTHRRTPEAWSPFLRSFLDPIRVGFYAVLTSVPLLVAHAEEFAGILRGQGG